MWKIALGVGAASLAWIGIGSGGSAPQGKRAWHPDAKWQAYWHQGKAEVTRFALEQSRYGEPHRGDAVLIFVTEDFRPKKQVKFEGRDANAAGAVPVLKLNQLRKFVTGVYDYSMMLSVFTPENLRANPRTLKTTASSQEWCGQVWLQANLRGDHYALTGHSYFDREADESFEVPVALLEDEVWSRIRIDPGALPAGDLKVVPGSFDSRLRHYRPRPLDAKATKGAAPASFGDGVVSYRIDYASGRSLAIYYDAAFPYRIRGFEESWRRGDTVHKTTARATHTERIAYWRRNKNSDSDLRAKLGLK